MSDAEVPKVDFDHWSPEYAADPWSHNVRYASRCPVARSDAHDGFWFVTGYDEVARVTRDDDTFSSRHDLPNGASPFLGTQHPPTPFRVVPLELDPPTHLKWRQPLNPLFAPAAVDGYRDRILAYTTWCIDQCIEKGSIDLVKDLTSPVPSLVNMDLLGIPLERGFEFAELSHALVYTDPTTPAFAEVYGRYGDAVASLGELVAARRTDPRDDVISALAHMEVDGAPISDAEAVEVLDLVVSAGIDTTASATSCALKHLQDHPDDRQQLAANPELIPTAVEEFLRYFSPVQVLARTATRDMELGGQQIRRGERVLVSWAAANVDERAFPEPCRVVLDREPNRHAAFGIGVHRCIGSHFARAEMAVMISEVLRRLPDYELQDGVEKYALIGVIHGYGTMPATFTPGERVGGPSALDALAG